MSEPLAPPLRAIDGLTLLHALRTATDWLAVHRDEVNALNVFPVPDGDTGTNMLLTLREAVAAGAEAARQETAAGPIAMAIAGGALIGARGNSGVILCQMIRGFALAVADRETISGPDVAVALASARDHAYAAVVEPVEGTMLTVVKGAAEAATAFVAAQPMTPDAVSVLSAALAGAREALAQTPALLAVLRAANVVDAGGQGIVHVLDGLVRFAGDGDVAAAPAAASPAPPEAAMGQAAAHGAPTTGFCINFLAWTPRPPDLERVRARLSELGTSVDLVAAEHALRVHLHADRPGPVLEYGMTLGELDRIEIDNMGLQTTRLLPAAPPAPAPAAPSDAADGVRPGEVGVLAVAPGAGLADALRSLGAAAVIGYQPAVNPSTADLLAGIAAIPTDQVIILPNNPNVQMAAQQAAKLADKAVTVVPSRSVPQGLAALSALAPARSLAENERRLTAALAGVRTVEVTHASRDAELNGMPVHAGDVIAFVDETLVATGAELVPVTLAALAVAELPAAELITLFTGAGLAPETALNLREAIQAAAPAATVEHIAGGQPHYPIMVAIE